MANLAVADIRAAGDRVIERLLNRTMNNRRHTLLKTLTAVHRLLIRQLLRP